METMSIECPHCRTQGRVDRTWEGRTIKCAHCGTAFPLQDTTTAPFTLIEPAIDATPPAPSIGVPPHTTARPACPYCAEEIPPTARLCPHCKQNLVNPLHHAMREFSDTDESEAVVPGIRWAAWGAGQRTVCVSAAVAVLAQCFPWVDMGFASASGISQGAFLLLGFFVYPCLALVRGRRINVVWGGVCAAGAVVATLSYIASMGGELFGEAVNVAAGGAYLFLFSAIALGIGVIVDHVAHTR